jgi:hypothetical protein
MTLSENHQPFAKNATRGVGRAYKRFEKDVAHILLCCFLFNPFSCVHIKGNAFHHGNHNVALCEWQYTGRVFVCYLVCPFQIEEILNSFY